MGGLGSLVRRASNSSSSNLSAIPDTTSTPSILGSLYSKPGTADKSPNFDMFGDWLTGGTFSSAALQDAQNKYNLWLYQNFQSPAAMMKQYEEAGLNPNFAAGGANGSPASASQATIQNKTVGNIVSIASLLNGFLGAMNQGVNLISDMQALPLDIAAKKWKNMLLSNQSRLAGSKADSAFARAIFDEMFYMNYPHGESMTPGGVSFNPQGSPAFQQMLSRNEVLNLTKMLREYDLNNLKPLERSKIMESVRALSNQANISQKTLDYFDSNTIIRLFALLLGAIR